ncbi:MAG: hypothetical protein L6Q81_12650 [Bacteroidia bacterium]|nr:hypothetical protein [Bacteroidia bacterium]
MSQIKILWSNPDAVVAFEVLNAEFVRNPGAFYSKHSSLFEEMISTINQPIQDAVVEMLQQLNSEVQKEIVSSYSVISRYEIQKLSGQIQASISPYAISTLLLFFLTTPSVLKPIFYARPSIDLDTFERGSNYVDLEEEILQGDFLTSAKRLSVYDRDDAPCFYYQLTPLQILSVDNLLVNSTAIMDKTLFNFVHSIAKESQTIILQINNE